MASLEAPIAAHALVTGRMTARVTGADEVRTIDNCYLAVWLKQGRS